MSSNAGLLPDFVLGTERRLAAVMRALGVEHFVEGARFVHLAQWAAARGRSFEDAWRAREACIEALTE